ncbi:Uncharacterised protein [Candidatus Gugararchaeum adminiculabundum]|nr:Uncharacterised protein [Candidatus Gugararchaeum adminiculabundum]
MIMKNNCSSCICILIFALTLALLAPLAFADSMMVTVTYNYGEMGIRHVEILPGSAPNYASDGPLILAYETGGTTNPVATFYMPLVSSTKDGIIIEDYAEQTLEIPLQTGAQALSIYNENGTLLAQFDLTGVTKAGDAKGTPPSGTAADVLGEVSIAGADKQVRNGQAKIPNSNSAANGDYGTNGGTDTGSGTDTNGNAGAGGLFGAGSGTDYTLLIIVVIAAGLGFLWWTNRLPWKRTTQKTASDQKTTDIQKTASVQKKKKR